MKVALLTDTHFGARNDSIHFLDFYEKFYRDIFFPKLEKEGIDTVLILGDTFDRRKYVNFYTYKRTREMFFDKMKDKNIKVYMLAGNHDTYYKNTNDVNSIDLMLKDYENIKVIDKPMTINVGNYDLCMVPWICTENYKECLEEIKNTNALICCGHFEIAGFAMYRGLPSEEGLDRAMFRKFEFTFSGHYHHKSSADGIYYLGNPYELTWQDYNDSRGFHTLDLESRDLNFIENTNVMFHRIVYDDEKESITDINNKDLSLYNNTYVKVVVVNKTNPYLFDKFMNNLYNVNPIDITIVEDYFDLSDDDDGMLDETEDTLTILNKYVDSIQEKDIDNNKLKNILRELYVEALNFE